MTEPCETAEPLLSAWLDGALEPWERAAVEDHVRRCPECLAELEELAATRALLRSLPVRCAPAALCRSAADVLARRRPRRLARAGLAVAATLAGLLSVAAFSLGSRPAPDARLVSVPVDVYAADHLVRTADDPLFAPVLLRSGP